MIQAFVFRLSLLSVARAGVLVAVAVLSLQPGTKSCTLFPFFSFFAVFFFFSVTSYDSVTPSNKRLKRFAELPAD